MQCVNQQGLFPKNSAVVATAMAKYKKRIRFAALTLRVVISRMFPRGAT
jgi:hypothetical protein